MGPPMTNKTRKTEPKHSKPQTLENQNGIEFVGKTVMGKHLPATLTTPPATRAAPRSTRRR